MIYWILACKDPSIELLPETPQGVDSAESHDSAGPLDTVPGLPSSACADIYAADLLPEFRIEISPEEWAAVQQDYASGQKNYHPIQFFYEAEQYEAALRLKGNPSFSWFTEKLQFVISFNETDDNARFHGLRKIALDASWYEPTLMRDRLAWDVMRRAEGLPTACVNNARLTINGSYYGAYANIEYFDHEWLERNFGLESTGTLYKYGSVAVANEEVADEWRIRGFWESTDVQELEGMGDLRQWIREWAAEAVLSDDDGYWCCAHNFYLYDHPSQGIMFVPWDFDDILDVTPYNSDPVTGYANGMGLFAQPQFQAVLNDPQWYAVYLEELDRLNTAMDPAVVLPLLDTWQSQVADSLQADPNRSFSEEESAQTYARLRAFIEARHAFLASWIACAQNRADDGDGDGFDDCSDPDDSRSDIAPSATEVCDSRDNDGDGRVDNDPACDDCMHHDVDDGHLLMCRQERSWTEAQQNCIDRGGILDFPRNTGEFYATWFHTWPQLGPWWIGATDAVSEGNWVDMSGQSANNYASWLGGQPDGGSTQNCAAWSEPNFGWSSESCSGSYPSICRLP